MDRRVRKTKKALREGLAELLNEKSIQNITVRELTDKVDIHRSTFYANFKDIYELYNHLEDTIIQEIRDIASMDSTFTHRTFFEGLFEYILRNKQIARLFFGGNINAAFFERMIELLKASCMECWRKEYNIEGSSKELDYYVQFCLSGSLGVVGMWVSRNFEYPEEALVAMLGDVDAYFGKFLCHKTPSTIVMRE